jgi:hypothetical protein
MDQKSKLVADRRKLTPTRSRKSPSGSTSTRAAAPAAKMKKRSKR